MLCLPCTLELHVISLMVFKGREMILMIEIVLMLSLLLLWAQFLVRTLNVWLTMIHGILGIYFFCLRYSCSAALAIMKRTLGLLTKKSSFGKCSFSFYDTNLLHFQLALI